MALLKHCAHRLIMQWYFLIPLAPLDKHDALLIDEKINFKLFTQLRFVSEYLHSIQKILISALKNSKQSLLGWFWEWILPSLIDQLQEKSTAIELKQKQTLDELFNEGMNSQDLSLDQKIMIFDLLKAHHYPENRLNEFSEKFLAATFKKPAQMKMAFSHFHQSEIWISENLYDIHTLDAFPESPNFWDLFGRWKFTAQYTTLFTLSLACYGLLAWTLIPLLTPSMASFLFFSVALAPAWYFIGTHSQALFQYAAELFSLPTKAELVEDLYCLKRSEQLILNDLTPAVLDLRKFDIQTLNQTVLQMETDLHYAIQKLEKTAWCDSDKIHTQKIRLRERLSQQKEYLYSALNSFINVLIENIETEMTLLCENAYSEKLTVYFTKERLQEYKNFISKWGSNAQNQEFNYKTDLSRSWLESCGELKCVVPSQDSIISPTPWGGFKLREDYLQGWETLLQMFVTNSEKKQACLSLLALIHGKIECDLQTVKKYIQTIDSGQTDLWLRKIHNILFMTLTERPHAHATLISDVQKTLCLDWYQRHRDQIVQSYILLAQAPQFNITEQKLESLLFFIQNDFICAYSRGDSEYILHHLSQIKKALEVYEGYHAWPFRLVFLLPKQEQTDYLDKVAQKRINWIFEHYDGLRKPFSKFDTQMIHTLGERHDNPRYFTMMMQSHPKFDEPWFKPLDDFFKICAQEGYDDGTLALLYQKQGTQIQCIQKKRSTNLQNRPKISL